MSVAVYSVNPGDSEFSVTVSDSGSTVSKNIELNVNMSATLIKDANASGGSRAITREEVIEGIMKIKNQILNLDSWPPYSS